MKVRGLEMVWVGVVVGMLGVAGCCRMMANNGMGVGEKRDPLPAHPEKGPFLFSYFLGNGDGLHLAVSADGLKFEPIGGTEKIWLKPEVGVNNDGSDKDVHLMRDPCIRQGPDGVYHMVWTSGWFQHGIGVASSADLVHWSRQQYVEVMKGEPAAQNSWAPELFYDDQKKDWLIFWATTIPGKFKETEPAVGGDRVGPGVNSTGAAGSGGATGGIALNHRLYYVTTRDFQTYSPTKLLYDPGFNCIDATITKRPDGKYFMVFKDETLVPTAKKYLRTSLADSPEGPWGKASDTISIDWVEGPTVAQIGDAWYIYYDEYTRQKYGAIRTIDFVKWEEVKENLSFPTGSRHGTVFPVTDGVVEQLKKEAGKGNS